MVEAGTVRKRRRGGGAAAIIGGNILIDSRVALLEALVEPVVDVQPVVVMWLPPG